MTRTGGCLCGAITFELNDVPNDVGACHCEMCRKASGGVFLALRVAPDNLKFTRRDDLRVYASSAWAERGFCGTCGSTLFYRVTAPGAFHGTWHLGLGTLDDPSGLRLTSEIYIDRKPDGYSFTDVATRMTEAEVLAMFGVD